MTDFFPNDENGEVLRRMQSEGDDLSRERAIDFTVVFPTRALAEEFANHFRGLGFEASVEDTNCVGELPWDVIVVKRMLPDHAQITRFEGELEGVASGLGGRNDGWSCMQQPRMH